MATIAPFRGLLLQQEAPAAQSAALPREGDFRTREGAPCFYAYRVDFRTYGGLEKTRLALIARIDPFRMEKPDIIPVVDSSHAQVDRTVKTLKADGLKTGFLIAGYEDA